MLKCISNCFHGAVHKAGVIGGIKASHLHGLPYFLSTVDRNAMAVTAPKWGKCDCTNAANGRPVGGPVQAFSPAVHDLVGEKNKPAISAVLHALTWFHSVSAKGRETLAIFSDTTGAARLSNPHTINDQPRNLIKQCRISTRSD